MQKSKPHYCLSSIPRPTTSSTETRNASVQRSCWYVIGFARCCAAAAPALPACMQRRMVRLKNECACSVQATATRMNESIGRESCMRHTRARQVHAPLPQASSPTSKRAAACARCCNHVSRTTACARLTPAQPTCTPRKSRCCAGTSGRQGSSNPSRARQCTCHAAGAGRCRPRRRTDSSLPPSGMLERLRMHRSSKAARVSMRACLAGWTRLILHYRSCVHGNAPACTLSCAHAPVPLLLQRRSLRPASRAARPAAAPVKPALKSSATSLHAGRGVDLCNAVLHDLRAGM